MEHPAESGPQIVQWFSVLSSVTEFWCMIARTCNPFMKMTPAALPIILDANGEQ